MASSKVMSSRSPPNSDLPRHHSSSNPSNLHSRGFDSMNMEEILRNIYSDSDSFAPENNAGGGSSVSERNKTVEEVWKDIVSGGGGGGGRSVEPAMTLEDFLTKAGAVAEEDVRVPAVQFGSAAVCVQNGGFEMDFGNGSGGGGGGVGRGKRRAVVEEVPLDKATQQKQRRMIKNRESAARSRERKQAYTVELESLVIQLEEENAKLLKEEAEMIKVRRKQLIENLIPVVEKRRPRPPSVLRRVRSVEMFDEDETSSLFPPWGSRNVAKRRSGMG
ncbi:hypothetical protein ACJIZ3_015720 [Penstemon smallii]|uniref:BZIP domain-containing protein n=1 Tax=Penstemon smallii TaxID=265156 RepID=A0ABD3RN99_9LAMI